MTTRVLVSSNTTVDERHYNQCVNASTLDHTACIVPQQCDFTALCDHHCIITERFEVITSSSQVPKFANRWQQNAVSIRYPCACQPLHRKREGSFVWAPCGSVSYEYWWWCKQGVLQLRGEPHRQTLTRTLAPGHDRQFVEINGVPPIWWSRRQWLCCTG